MVPPNVVSLDRDDSAKDSAEQQHGNLGLLTVESLDVRTLLTTLIVDIGDLGCSAAGPVYCEIQEAEDAASPGDTIEVASGIYLPVVIDVNDITIREANANSDPLIDATGATNGLELIADGVTIRGLEVQNANENGFLVTGDNNSLTRNTATGNGNGFHLASSNGNKIIRNTATDNGNGFHLESSNGNKIIRNTASDNVSWGFLVDAVLTNKFHGNVCNGNGLGGSNQPGVC